MKNLLALAISIFATNIFPQSEINKSFFLECELLDQVVVSIDQGKSQTYGGWKEGINIGEKFYLKFRYTQDIKNNFNFRLTIPKEIKGPDIDSIISMTQLDISYETPKSIFFERGSGNKRELRVDFDSLIAKDEWNTLDLNRYYKNDWELLFFNRSPKNYQTGTANCMSMPKEYDEVLKVMQEIMFAERGVEVNRPDSNKAETQEKAAILIIIENDKIYMDGRRIDVGQVKANVLKLLADNPQGSVVIQADEKAVADTIIKVMDEAREAGVLSISLASEPK